MCQLTPLCVLKEVTINGSEMIITDPELQLITKRWSITTHAQSLVLVLNVSVKGVCDYT